MHDGLMGNTKFCAKGKLCLLRHLSACTGIQPRAMSPLCSHLEWRGPSLLLQRIHAQPVVQVAGEVRQGV